MKAKNNFFRSFYFKIAASFVLSLLFVAILGDAILFRYSLKSQFNQIRDKFKIITQTAVLAINSEQLSSIPLNPQGINTVAFKEIAVQLLKIKQANPLIRYIYIMGKTDQPGILQFIVDPDALVDKTAV